jgi:hypothetical protein
VCEFREIRPIRATATTTRLSRPPHGGLLRRQRTESVTNEIVAVAERYSEDTELRATALLELQLFAERGDAHARAVLERVAEQDADAEFRTVAVRVVRELEIRTAGGAP